MRLEVTRKSDLAVRSLLELWRSDGRIKAPLLADRIGTTPAFVPQVLSPLVAAGWVRSDPGPTGGYSLRADLVELSLLEVIEAIEGPTDSGRCVLVDGACDASEPCSLHSAWQRARRQLLDQLGSTAVGSIQVRTVSA